MGDSGDFARAPPRATKVKNKAAAEQQITAEQLLREARERTHERPLEVPRQHVADEEELRDLQGRKRKQFEDDIRIDRTRISVWLSYARFEADLHELERSRSVFERCLDEHGRVVAVWLKYAQMEMKNKSVNRARNIWDRATYLLPRVDQFWYKYVYMEEMLGNVDGARKVFERWMQWQPEEQAWNSYIRMELRYGETGNARQIFERFVVVHPEVRIWVKYARFEERAGDVAKAREVYDRAVTFFGDEFMDEALFVAFCHFEESQKEFERARVIYKYALEHIPKERARDLLKNYTQFEKKHGDRAGVEDVIVNKRRFTYEEEVAKNATNYDAWFDYIRLEEGHGDPARVRAVYERAILNVPPSQEKRLWRRYIYLWIYYAVYEELEARDVARAREVYRVCLSVVPNKKFTFAKVWLMFAHFELRQRNVSAARRILGQAVGMCPKDKILKGYIDLELQLREFDRCRTLYERYLELNPANCSTWIKYAELESLLGDEERARAIFELAVGQEVLDMPEMLWKSFIDFEVDLEEWDRVRHLYRALLDRTQHVKVFLSFAKFEATHGTAAADDEGRAARVRAVYKEGDDALRVAAADADASREDRALLFEAWQQFEAEHGDADSQAAVAKRAPRKVKKRRAIIADDGTEAGMEEYFDYIFPDETAAAPNLKLLEMARLWKAKQEAEQEADSEPGTEAEAEAAEDREAEAEAEAEADVDADEPPNGSGCEGVANGVV